MKTAPFRRIVTGHDTDGRAVILEDAPPPRVARIGGEDGAYFYEVWNTRATPAPIDAASGEPPEETITLAPPASGTRIRVVDFPPENDRTGTIAPEQARSHFEQMGAEEASSFDGEHSRHPYTHRTETIDYGIILDGEITLIVDEGETTMHKGDIAIQRGTNHAWANRSGQTCRVAFILIDGAYDGTIAP